MKSSVHFDVFVCLSCHTEYTTMWNNSNKSQSNCWIVILCVYLNESLYAFAVCVYVWAYILSQESSFRPLYQTSDSLLGWLQCQAPDLQKKRIAVICVDGFKGLFRPRHTNCVVDWENVTLQGINKPIGLTLQGWIRWLNTNSFTHLESHWTAEQQKDQYLFNNNKNLTH